MCPPPSGLASAQCPGGRLAAWPVAGPSQQAPGRATATAGALGASADPCQRTWTLQARARCGPVLAVQVVEPAGLHHPASSPSCGAIALEHRAQVAAHRRGSGALTHHLTLLYVVAWPCSMREFLRVVDLHGFAARRDRCLGASRLQFKHSPCAAPVARASAAARIPLPARGRGRHDAAA